MNKSIANGIDPTIFKSYDIRGIYPEQLNEETAYALGRAYATFMKRETGQERLKVAVGRDMRLSSDSLKKNLVQGLLDSGIDVEDIGLVSSPTFYFGVAFFGLDGGIQVSASHNPKEWNGFKLVRKGAVPISGDSGIKILQEIMDKEQFVFKSMNGRLSERKDVVETEVADQSKPVDIAGIKPFKIVADTANGMGTLDLEALFAKLPCQLVKMNFALDGSFPVHEADPMKPENTADLSKKVIFEKADLGIAADGDADRYFFLDERGRVIPQAVLRGLMAQIELKEHPGAKVAYDIRPGRITRDMIERMGGEAIVTRVGHSLIKEAMIKADAIFGGESSGHYFYKFPYGTFESPILLILKLLKYLSMQNKPFSEVIKEFDVYAHSGEINMPLTSREIGLQKIEEIKKRYQDGKQIFIDGVTVEYPDVWFNLRLSNTEPLIRLAVEGKTEGLMKQKTQELLELIRK